MFTKLHGMNKAVNKITVEEFAATQLNRRGKQMSYSYIYRLIREHNKGKRNDLWFKYEFEGNKDRIWIIN